MAAAERYSDRRVNEDFTCYVLLNEPLQADVAEILAALREDFPTLDWPDPAFPGPSGPFDTNAGTSLVWGDGVRLSLIAGAGRCSVAFDYDKSLLFPGAQQAVADHRSYLSISAGSAGPDLVDRFRAARRMTCFAALFAKLPICTAVYLSNSDGIVAPSQWVAAADKALADDFPIEHWISFPLTRYGADDDGPPPVTCNTIGMAAFNGREILVPQARIPAGDVAGLAMGAVWLQVVSGNSFGDGNTFGVEDEPARARMRFLPEGPRAQTDTWVLLDKSCRLDEMALFGERQSRPAPEGHDNRIQPRPDHLKQLLRASRTGRGPGSGGA
ncbi:hypothetical protein [Actibacterium ureilyticum]|uniref:hypothetical protein n=1 Tax=Actibacterium ureilyticum TaxID=1590614 RepID=UPI000BAAB05E|nr:hypothetical protein [Actibacterium ureilyticum]